MHLQILSLQVAIIVLALIATATPSKAQVLALCDGETWQTEEPKASKKPQLPLILSGSFHGSLSEGPVPGITKSTPLPTGKDADWGQKNHFTIQFQYQLPATSTPWQSTVEDLSRLGAHQRQKLLETAGLSQPASELATLPTWQLEQRVELLKKLIDSESIEITRPALKGQVLYLPLAADASNKALESIADPSNIALTRLDYLQVKTTAQALSLLQGHSDILMTGQGTPAPEGSLGAVPSGKAVRVDSINGKRCLRPIVGGRYTFNPKTASIDRAWDPAAFSDVGILLKRTAGAENSLSVCSFVRVSDKHILTAAHCVARVGSNKQWEKLWFGKSGLEALALLPILNSPTKDPRNCFENPARCGFYVTAVTGSAVFPNGDMNWLGDVPSPDIALLSASFPEAQPPSTHIARERTKPQLTLAGYGLMKVSEERAYGGDLQVGWNETNIPLEGSLLSWYVQPEKGKATGCIGDSGGAVFDGDISGPNDARRLAGLISFARGTQFDNFTPIANCAGATLGVATSLQKHVPWICDISQQSALGCEQTDK